MRCTPIAILLIMLASAVSAVAGTSGRNDFDASALSAAFPGSRDADGATIMANIQRRLPSDMSVATYEHFVVAASGPVEETIEKGRLIAGHDAQIRRRYFPDLEPRHILVILGDDATALQELARILYPEIAESSLPPSGFYHPKDRLILATTTDGYRAIMHALMQGLVQDDNPDAPRWFAQAMATLYESSDMRADRLTPILDERMGLIAPDEDLAYDVFAGICDCSAVTAEQLALIRLLLVYLEGRDQLTELYAAIKQQGQYTTLLQALETMDLDREAWKAFAERRVHAYWKSRG
jgi:hypothetical protein